MDYKESYQYWLSDSCFDEAAKEELRELAGKDEEIKERFFKNLEFGTGGMRGIMGMGTNRMNIYTVRRATQGLARYILKQGDETAGKGVALAYDSRNHSGEFAMEAALVLCGNGIKSYVFDELRPTPELSFAVRRLGCTAGIVITASHNPPEYNGYKAYWADGGQIPYPRDEAIIEEVNQVEFSQILRMDRDEAEKSGLLQIIGEEIDAEFIENVKAQSIDPELIREMGGSLTVVYTPLHGTGNKPVRRALEEMGFQNVHVVPVQEQPDGSFPTVGYPNPEDPKAFALAMKLADQVGADLVVGTDPDADRVGAVVKNAQGEYVILTGNMTGVLLTEYILSRKQAAGRLPENGAVISTIVSTDLTKEIAKHYGATYIDVLTGFKYIGEKIKEFEENDAHTFQFGFEESYGCLAGTYARDKDAVVASLLICELAAFYKKQGLSLYEALQEIYKKYGYYKEGIESITLKGLAGLSDMQRIMARLREEAPSQVAGIRVVEARDYKSSIVRDMLTGQESSTNLPASDVLYYVLEDGGWFCVRPSGTEPKIKIYFGVKGDTMSQAEEKLKEYVKSVMERIDKELSNTTA